MLFHFIFTCSLSNKKLVGLHHVYHFFGANLKQKVNLPACLEAKQALRPSYHISRVVCSQAEVSDLHMVLRVQEDVDRFQVPVNHTLKHRR